MLDAQGMEELKLLLETQYSDGITSISRAQLDDSDNIVGIFEDKISPALTKRYAFKITDEEIGYRLMNAKEISNFIESANFGESENSSPNLTIMLMFARLRDYLIGKEGLETADKTIALDALYSLANDEDEEDEEDEEEGFTKDSRNLTQTIPMYKEMNSDYKEKLDATAAELAKQAQKIAARQAELDRREDTDFTESLIKEGRALPGEKDKLVKMLGTMRQNETIVEFSEEEKPQMLDAFKEMLIKRPPVIAFGEHAPSDRKPKHSSINFQSPEGTEVDSDALEVHEKAIAYQEAHPGTDYIAAISKVGGN